MGVVLEAARAEVASAQHGYVGLEHMLVAFTGSWAGSVSGLLAQVGVSGERARDAVRLVVGEGRGDGPRWDAAALLATLGIDLDEVRRAVTERFGADAVERLYASEVGWNLRPQGPLCGPALSPQFKQTIDRVVGRCWDSAPHHFHERLLRSALDVSSGGLSALLDELDVPAVTLRAVLDDRLRLAG
ncbi:Clp protease N-terminal domain-containing protein [Pseudofrankia asymbiotica]|uniref:Clp protease N-terminal domain-containing protein n=1 Tax=Pseudofrankia asymbiotica TaxID=1834516 RepID=UPI0013044AED|nr:Clp protease N-terminal domain-containing protein [Pseudofrankia asymbiotica]